MTELSKAGSDALVSRLCEERVLHATVAQLRKDLATGSIASVPLNARSFEALRVQVVPILEDRHKESVHALQVALYRVDVPEQVAREAMQVGGLNELAGRVVLRCLQKVITRLHLRPH